AVRGPSASYHERIFKPHTERVVQLRTSKCHRQRRTRHEGKMQFTRPVVHLPGLRPIVGEMLVAEYGNRPSGFPEYLNHLFEEFITRIELLLLIVERIVPVFRNHQHAVYIQFAST